MRNFAKNDTNHQSKSLVKPSLEFLSWNQQPPGHAKKPYKYSANVTGQCEDIRQEQKATFTKNKGKGVLDMGNLIALQKKKKSALQQSAVYCV